MTPSELALEKTNAEIKALQESVACLDRKLTQLLSATSPAKSQSQLSQTAFDVLTGPSMPRSRSTATLDRLNAQSFVDNEELAMGTTRVVMHQIVLPSDSDTLGICFGGQVLGWIDICAGLAAKTVARGPCVTASVDAVHFLKPCRVVGRLCASKLLVGCKSSALLFLQGSVAIIAAMVNRTFQSSLEVEPCTSCFCSIPTTVHVLICTLLITMHHKPLDLELMLAFAGGCQSGRRRHADRCTTPLLQCILDIRFSHGKVCTRKGCQAPPQDYPRLPPPKRDLSSWSAVSTPSVQYHSLASSATPAST